MNIICPVCGRPISGAEMGTQHVAQRITGWEVHRRAGGTNHVLHRETLDEWAHTGCLRAKPTGAPLGEQLNLL